MEALWISLTAAGVLLLLILLQVLMHSKKPVQKAVGGIFVGLAALLVVNLTGTVTGGSLPLSPLVLGTASVAGVPGVTTLLLLNLLLQ